MAGTNITLRRSLRLINCFNPQESLKWNCLVRNLYSLSSYSSNFGFRSTLHRGRKEKSIPKVPHDTRSNFLNFSEPGLYNGFLKPCAGIASMAKPSGSVINIQDNLEDFLDSELPIHSKLIRGQLKNGLHYCILQHKKHSKRFKANLVVHVGPINEEEDEQGIAHMTEHVLESDKCAELVPIGATYSAYTHFHQTVYYLTSQTILEHFDEDLLDGPLVDGELVPYVLDALNQLAFKPKIRASSLKKERHVVLSELQMFNTVDERAKVQFTQHLHSENKLSERSNILGLEDQIMKWNIAQIKKFHKRWYFPGNATLYIVGDIIDVSKTIDAIQVAFGKSKRLPKKRSSEMKNEWPIIFHNWSLPQSNIDDKKLPQLFQHELIHNFSFDICSKIPITKFRTYGDLRNFIMKKIYLSILRFRINAKFESSNSSSILVELNHGDVEYYGCALTMLSITSEPKDWKTTIKAAFHEVRRLKELGISDSEFTVHKDAILKEFAVHLIAVIDDCSIRETMEFIMEKDALGHNIMEEREGYESLTAIATTITLEETNSIGGELLEFISDFGKPSAPVPTIIMVCAPTVYEVNGEPVEFTINSNEIESAIKQGLKELIYAEPEIEAPTELISSKQLQKLCLERKPTFIPITGSKPNVKKFHDNGTNITQRRLSNGISVNYKISENERDEGVIRVIIGGGRALESSDLKGAIAVGVRTLYEGACVGHFSRVQVDRFCLKNILFYHMESTEEFISVELKFSLRGNGMQAAFQLLHMLLEQSTWLEDAFDRAKQLQLSKFQSNLKSLEQSTVRKLILTMLDGDERFVEPTQISLQNLTLESVKDAVLNQLIGNNMEVSIVGDFSKEDLESNIINYLGTLKATRNFKNKLHQYDPIMYNSSPSHLQSQIFLKDTEERICAYIAGLVPNYWGFTIDGKHWLESKLFIEKMDLQSKLRDHPLFFAITMEFLTYMIEDRLSRYITGLGLAYNVQLDLRLFHKLNLGWYMISIPSTPYMVHKALGICKKFLKDFGSEVISQEDLDEVRGCLLNRHEEETQSNAYWLKLLWHFQDASSPRKDKPCIKDLSSLYKAVGIEDIHFAYNQLKVNDDSIYSSIGIARQHESISKYA